MYRQPTVAVKARAPWQRIAWGFWGLMGTACLATNPIFADAASYATPQVTAQHVASESPGTAPRTPQAGARVDINDFSVVEVRTKGLPDARSSGTLGRNRQGGGIVIDEQGLILTIGYLVTEAESIEVRLPSDNVIPASVVAHDSATGLGLIRTAVPLQVPPIKFADSEDAKVTDPVLVVGFDGVAPAYIVSRREFAGSWEYLLEDALFTAPATTGWSGAALIDRAGRLLGVGSLLVTDALGPKRPLPGNMFVPIDVLKPILNDLIADGKAKGPQRPWLGLNAEEVRGRVLVTRVSDDSPAARSGLDEGDIILGVDGKSLDGLADFYRSLWATANAGDEVELKVLKGSEITEVQVTSMERAQYLRPQAVY